MSGRSFCQNFCQCFCQCCCLLVAMALAGQAEAWPSARAAEPGVLTVRADEWLPVNGDPGSDHPGFAIELLNAIYSPLGVTVDYQLSGWSRSLELAQAGAIDCVVGTLKVPGRELLFPQIPLGYSDTAFYVRGDDHWDYQGLESLQGRSVGVIANYSYGESMDAWLRTSGADQVQPMHGLRPLERNLHKLLSGRLDVVIESPMVMEYLLSSLGKQGQVREAGRQHEPSAVYLACAPGKPSSADYIREFDVGMRRLRDSGQLQQIMARYGLQAPVWPES